MASGSWFQICSVSKSTLQRTCSFLSESDSRSACLKRYSSSAKQESSQGLALSKAGAVHSPHAGIGTLEDIVVAGLERGTSKGVLTCDVGCR